MLTIVMINIVFYVISYLELHSAIIIYCIAHFFCQQTPDWVFGHYRTLTSLLGKILHD